MSSSSDEDRIPPVDEIDPASVPDWPHPVVSVGPDGVDIDGRPLALPADVAPESGAARQLALRSVAEQYAELGRPIKVRARDPDGVGWDLIVTPDGSVAPFSDEPAEYPGRKAPRRRDARQRSRRGGHRSADVPDKKRGLVAVGIFVCVVLLMGAGALALTHRGGGPVIRPKRTVVSTPPPANLPVPAPPGYRSRAAWAMPVNKNDAIAVTPTHEVALINGDGDLEVRDIKTGVLRWKADLPLNTTGDLHLTTVDGKDVIALGGVSSMLYWRLDDPQHLQHTVKLPQGATLSFVGKSPLVILPDQTAAFVNGDEVKLVDVPVGATPIASDGSSILAVSARGSMWKLTGSGGPLPAPTKLDAPAKNARVMRAAELKTGMFLVAWRYGSTRMIILYLTPGGAELGRKPLLDDSLDQTAESTGNGTDGVAASDDGSVAVMGDMVVFPNKPRAYTVSGLQISTVTSDHVYGTDQTGASVDITVKGKRRMASADSAPGAVDALGALVPAEKLGSTLLYSLPPKNSTVTPEPSASPSTSKGP